MSRKTTVGRNKKTPVDSTMSLYHVAFASNLPLILEQGILPADSTHRDDLETELSQIAANHGIDFPVARQDCVFLYPSLDVALRGIDPDTEYDRNLISHSGILVVDAASIGTSRTLLRELC